MASEGIPVDAEVYTQDGTRLGKVKEVRGHYFKVDASFTPDYWLSDQHVASTSGNDVRLSFVKETLEQLKADEPPQ